MISDGDFMVHHPPAGDLTRAKPLIWVLTGEYVGDNGQVLRAAEAMGCPFEVKHFKVLSKYAGQELPIEPVLYHIDMAKSDRLEAPWPDLCITIGRRLSMVALWIKQQSEGKSRIALFNVPKGMKDEFDLLVVPNIYKIKGGPRICQIGFPISVIDPVKIQVASRQFNGILSAMKRPLNVLLLGGNVGPRQLSPKFATETLNQLKRQPGSIFVSTSRRTSAMVADVLEQRLRPQDKLYRWSEKATDNPYFALLAQGDTFTVTDDSMSMITEVARLGKPMMIAESPDPFRLLRYIADWLGFHRVRDMRRAKRFLYENGFAVKLGEPVKMPSSPLPDDTWRVASALLELVRGR